MRSDRGDREEAPWGRGHGQNEGHRAESSTSFIFSQSVALFSLVNDSQRERERDTDRQRERVRERERHRERERETHRERERRRERETERE